MAYSEVKTGKLLLAKPFMFDPNFMRSVIILCEHEHEGGSLGFIMNKPLKMKVEELVEDFPDSESKVFYGGPVATNTLHYIHDKGDILEESVEVSPGIYWGGNFEKLKFLVENKLILPKNIRYYIGYSGWSAGQLEEEMEDGSWYTGDGDANYIFNSKPYKLWRQAMYNKGDHYTVLAEMPDVSILN